MSMDFNVRYGFLDSKSEGVNIKCNFDSFSTIRLYILFGEMKEIDYAFFNYLLSE